MPLKTFSRPRFCCICLFWVLIQGVRVRKIILLAIVWMTPQAYAACPDSVNSSHLVITLEGLFGRALGSRAQQLAESVNRTGYQIANFSHATRMTKILECVRQFQGRNNERQKFSIIGHSLGGPAANRLAQAMAEMGIEVETMIVFDSRNGSDTRCGSNGGPSFPKPENVGHLYNFYQCGFLPGRRYTGRRVSNVQLYETPHIELPQTVEAYRVANRALNIGGQSSGPSTDLQTQ